MQLEPGVRIMNIEKAEKIIHEYGAAIASTDNAFKKISTLPCSKAMIRYAYCVYIPAIIERVGSLPEEIGENLVSTYCMLDVFVPDDEAERLNSTFLKIKSQELDAANIQDKVKIDEYFSRFSSALRNSTYFDEINAYIGECYREHAK